MENFSGEEFKIQSKILGNTQRELFDMWDSLPFCRRKAREASLCVPCTPDHQLRGSTAPRPSPPRDQTTPSLENTAGHGCSSISPGPSRARRTRLPPAQPRRASSPACGHQSLHVPSTLTIPILNPPPTKSISKKNVFLALKSLENVCNSNTNFLKY